MSFAPSDLFKIALHNLKTCQVYLLIVLGPWPLCLCLLDLDSEFFPPEWVAWIRKRNQVQCLECLRFLRRLFKNGQFEINVLRKWHSATKKSPQRATEWCTVQPCHGPGLLPCPLWQDWTLSLIHAAAEASEFASGRLGWSQAIAPAPL